MATVTHLFAGITDYFKAYGAKSYDQVLDNAKSRFDPSALKEKRYKMVQDFEKELSKNKNLSPEEIRIMGRTRNARHALGDFIENSFGRIGMVNSAIGGTVGYGTKRAIQGAFRKRSTEAIEKETPAIVQKLSSGAGSLSNGISDGVSATKAFVAGISDGASENVIAKVGAAKEAISEIPGQVADGTKAATKATAKATWNATKTTARWAGKETFEGGKDLGGDLWGAAKWVHNNRNSRGVTIAVGAGTLALMPAAYEGGQLEEKYQHKMRQVASNMEVSSDGGGTFLRPNQSPQVENMGATGDLVFALHSLRNGG